MLEHMEGVSGIKRLLYETFDAAVMSGAVHSESAFSKSSRSLIDAASRYLLRVKKKSYKTYIGSIRWPKSFRDEKS